VEFLSGLLGLEVSFRLLPSGFFRRNRQVIYSFRDGVTGFFLVYGNGRTDLHCFEGTSPAAVSGVINKLYLLIVLPHIRNKREKRVRFNH